MGWFRNLFRAAEVRANGSVPEPSVTFSHDIPTPIDDLISRVDSDLSDAPVPRDRALTVPAVLRGRNLLCSIATLPLVTRDRDRLTIRTPLLDQIDPNVPDVVTLSQTVEDLVFEGVAWWHVTDRLREDGRPREAEFVHATRVSINPPPGAPPRRLPSGEYPGGVVWLDGRPVPGRDMIRFDSPNPGILTAAARAIRRAIVLEKAAAMYANDPRPLDYFAPVDGADEVDDDDVERILADWQAARRTRATAYVPAALSYHSVSTPTPADLQLVELQKQAVIEIANAMGLDSEDLQVSTTSRTYANATDRRRDRINDVLSPYMRAITDRLSMNDVTRRGYRVGFDLDDYMRADPSTRWSTYEVGLRNNVVSVPEVREIEGLPSVPIEPRPQPNSDQQDDQQEETSMSTRAARFSADDGAVRVAFDLADADVEFRVNREKRTISGLLVPWSTIARSGFAKYRFAKDSLSWTHESRVKLNREHDRREAVGVATRLQSTPKGLDGSFRIARGEDGDRVLSLAEDGVLDGFSIEAEFGEDGYELSRDSNDDLVRDVKAARLVGVAITASPAFDDARVSSVAASRKDKDMTGKPDEPTGARSDAAGPDTAAFTAAVEAFSQQAGAFTDAVRGLVEAQQAREDVPPVVDPTRRTAQLSVREESLYRFDGSSGKHDFSSDMIASQKGDKEALARIEGFIAENFAYEARTASFAVGQSDAGALNPNRNRPDMYVDELGYATPIWNSINRGTIPDNTPFVLPKFDSKSGLVNDHTEGTEPTSGSFSTTSQTITPSPVSGKVEITREAWDQGGSPQLSVIMWRAIVREYMEALEQAAADLLAGLTVTQVALTAGATDDALASELKRALAALQFVRGGNRFRDFKIQEDLYIALADAKDSNGRPLFPILSPSNADGSTDSFFGTIAIGGLGGVPAWALGSGTTSSYLYNREDVHGWASNPQRLQFEYRVAHVDIGVWGYKALACTRTDGVREVVYDPTAPA